MESYTQGTLAGAGTFRCESCGFAVALYEQDAMPPCPHCEGLQFKRASLFGELAESEPWGSHEPPAHEWLAAARERIGDRAEHLAWQADGGDVTLVELTEECTRIGRSLAADVRFDDPTVSRRHALLHRDGGVVRLLDDRSLNGVFVDGERVEEHVLADGEEIRVGRFSVWFLAPTGRRGRRLFAHAGSR